MLSYTTEATYPQLVVALNNPGAVDTVYLTTDANANHLTLTLSTTAASAHFSPGQLVAPEQAPDGTGSLLYLDLSALNIPAADFARLVCAAPGWQTKLFANSIVGLTPEQFVSLTPGQSIELHIEGLVVPNPPGAPSVNLNLRYYRVPPCVEGTLPQVKFFKVVLQAPPSNHGKLYEAVTCVVVGSNYVCNSAESYRPVSNQLSFALQPGPAPAQVPAGADTQFVVSFVYAEAAPGYGALTTPQQATQLTVRQGLNASGWSITPLLAAENPSWLLIPPAGIPLVGAGTEAVVEFTLDGIVTSFAPGPTLLYVQYRNVQGYNDGAYTLFINKIAHVAIQELTVTPSPAVLNLTGQAQVRVSWTASDAGTLLLYPGPQDVTNLDYYDTVISGTTDFVLLAEGRYMASQGNVAQRQAHVDTLPFGNHGLYIRRHLGDSPPTPSGGWPDSPDIISAGTMPLFNTSQLTTSAAYSQGTPNALLANPQDFNFVYLRALNPYATPLASTVFLYYVEKSLLMWPQNWRPASYAGAATNTNAVQLEAPANGLVATQLPLAWIPPTPGTAYVLLTWVQSGPDQGTPPNLADIQSGLGVDEFLAKYANVSWREVSMSSAVPPTVSQYTAIAGANTPTTLHIGLQCVNVPTDSFIAFCAPGPNEQNTVIFPKSPVINPNFTPTYQVEWPANFNSTIYYRWYQGETPPPASMNLVPIVAAWGSGIAATQSEEEPTAESPHPLASVGDAPTNDWNTLFGNVAQQGEQFNAALSPSDYYYAFLSKADFDETTKLWDILFEVVPREWADNAVLPGGESLRLAAPDGPASLYHLPAVAEAPLLKTLGLKSTDDLAEGSWYLLQLRKQDTGTLNGNLYDPDIDLGGKKQG